MSGTATPSPTAMDVDSLAQLIERHMANTPQAQSLSGDVKDAFCKNWPTAKPVLTALSGLLAAIPGVGVFAGPAIAVVTAAGDAASKAACGPK